MKDLTKTAVATAKKDKYKAAGYWVKYKGTIEFKNQ